MYESGVVKCCKTKLFSIFSLQTELSDVKFVLRMSINCAYTSSLLKEAISKRSWYILDERVGAEDTLTGVDKKVVQLGDFENINWESAMSGDQIASSYLIRKGLSRKAQLAMQIRRYLSKHRDSILLQATPFTLILETWNAFEDMRVDFGAGTFADFDSNLVMNVAFRQRLEWCLEDTKLAMEDHNCDHWILKSSVTNKGADIIIIKDWESLLNALEEVPDIREWVLQK